MEKIYTGKTKDVFKKENGNLLFYFKDDVTGEEGIVDPGANQVMGQIKGKGKMSLEMSNYFFQVFLNKGVPTHFILADLENNSMEVKETRLPGGHLSASAGLEFISRQKAYGSFLRRYKKYIREELQPLNYLVEITLKDDERGDPLINDDTLLELGILNENQLKQGKELTRRAARIIEEELIQKELYLVDIKFEFGLLNKEVVLIDEVSADCMRVMDSQNRVQSHEEIYRKFFEV